MISSYRQIKNYHLPWREDEEAFIEQLEDTDFVHGTSYFTGLVEVEDDGSHGDAPPELELPGTGSAARATLLG